MLKVIIAFKLAMLLMVYKYLPARLIHSHDRNQTRKGKPTNTSTMWNIPDAYRRYLGSSTNTSQVVSLRTPNMTKMSKESVQMMKNITARNLTATGKSVLLLAKDIGYFLQGNIKSTSRTLPPLSQSINEIVTKNASISVGVTVNPSKSVDRFRTGILESSENEKVDQAGKDSDGRLQVYHTSAIQPQQIGNNGNVGKMLNGSGSTQSVEMNSSTELFGQNYTNGNSTKYHRKNEGNENFTANGEILLKTDVKSNETLLIASVRAGEMRVSLVDKIQPTRNNVLTTNTLPKLNLKNATSACNVSCKFRKKLRELLKNRYSEPN